MADKKRIILPVAVILAVSTLLYLGLRLYKPADNRLKVSGNIETTETQAGFEIAGRVLERKFDEGQPVAKGDLLAVLDDSALSREVDMRRADVATANATLAELVTGNRRQDINSAKADLDKALAEADRQSKDTERMRVLYREQVISTQEFDRSKADLVAAQSAAKSASEKLSLMVEGSRREEIAQAAAKLESARQALALAQVNLEHTRIFAPTAGMVLTKNVEPGEYVSPGTPVVTIGDLENIWLRAYIPETELGRIKLGQPASVSVDTFPGRTFNGTIAFISDKSEFTPKSIQTEKERVKLVYRIKINIRNPDQELKPGMPADAVIVEQ